MPSNAPYYISHRAYKTNVAECALHHRLPGRRLGSPGEHAPHYPEQSEVSYLNHPGLGRLVLLERKLISKGCVHGDPYG
jgi:hypothetical protein